MIQKRLWLWLGLLALPSVAQAITSGQTDAFEDGTPMAWEEGPFSPNPPTNIVGGGPGGAGDHYLLNVSSGEFASPGGKMVMNNLTQWTGNYVAAGVSSLRMDLANFGTAPLYVRIALQGATGQYCSRLPFLLPADGQWRTATFGLNATDLAPVALNVPLPTFLTGIGMIRILSAQSAPSFHGDEIAGSLGVDNISANSASAVGETDLAAAHRLSGAPNPFSGSTRLRYVLRQPGAVTLDIFDVAGRAVRHVVDTREQAAGAHEWLWDGRATDGSAVAPGVYFARLATDAYSATTRLQLVR